MSTPPEPARPLLSQALVGVYIPSLFLIGGCYAIRKDLLPVAVLIAASLIGYNVYDKHTRPVLKPRDYQKFPLKQKTVLSHNTAVYRFKLPTSGSILGLPIGQHISVRTKIKGEDVMRSYTPITSDDTSGHFDLLVKSYPTGNISRHMGEMKLGDKLEFAGPKGAMVYTPNMKRHIGMIAGGTGITPMWQIVSAILKGRPIMGGDDNTEVDLIFANVNEDDILMKKELDALAAKDKNFRIHYVLNNPPEGWKGGVGFVTPEIIKSAFPPPAADTKVLVCGPPPMVKAMKAATESLGYDKAGSYSKRGDQVYCF